MAILHFKLHGPQLGVSALQRYEYLAAELPHFSRGQVEHVDSGNLPDFAEGRARDFWCAADGYERVNGRVFSEIEAALPHELTGIQNEALAGEAVQDFLGGTFPHTMAIHSLLDAEDRLQRHMHIMFCARPVTAATSVLPPERFFKRNGAKKDRGWNNRTKPYSLRVRWCNLLNGSLTRAGFAGQLSPGKKLDGSVEPKVVGLSGEVNSEAARQVRAIRKERRDIASLVEECEREADMKIAALEANLIAELLKLDELAATL
nr:MobA/MobL family protein [Granulicella aggregans]